MNEKYQRNSPLSPPSKRGEASSPRPHGHPPSRGGKKGKWEEKSKTPPHGGGRSAEGRSGGAKSKTPPHGGGRSAEGRSGGAKKKALIQANHRLPYNPKLKERARELRKNMTAPEKKLWHELQNLPTRVLRQRPIAHFIVDFYIPKYKLIIEVDGESHYTKAGETYDAERSAVLTGLGLTVLRFTNPEVMKNITGVAAEINRHLTQKNP